MTSNIARAQTRVTGYGGRSSTANWRPDAANRIEANRKADFIVQVVDSSGASVDNADVEINMQSHAFNFGAAVNPKFYLPIINGNPNPDYNPTYEQKIHELFNSAVFFNALKWRQWENPNRLTATNASIDRLQDNDMTVRGHAMLWTRYQSVPDDIRSILATAIPTNQEKQTLYDRTFSHIQSIGAGTNGELYHWDVLNEPRTSNLAKYDHDNDPDTSPLQFPDIEAVLEGFTPAGSNAPNSDPLTRQTLRKRWFEKAQSANSSAQMVLNDFRILAGGNDVDSQLRMNHKAIVQGLLDAGTPLDGLGFQAHFNDIAEEKPPTNPFRVLQMLDSFQEMFDDAGRDFSAHVTEYDFDIDGNISDLSPAQQAAARSLQEDYTRDFLTATFAHKAVDGFTFWGFWEGDRENDPGGEDKSLFNQDFSEIQDHGQAYLDLVFDEWWTEVTGVTANGVFETRGFLGEYEVTVTHNGKTYTELATLGIEGQNLTVVVGLPGDFDFDGNVDIDDLDEYNGRIGASPVGDLELLDLDSDGDIDFDDMEQHFTQLVETSNGGQGTFAGDVNLDGTVDVLGDAFALVGNLGKVATSWSQGDINGDGTVDVLGDAFLLVGNLGNSNPGSSVSQ